MCCRERSKLFISISIPKMHTTQPYLFQESNSNFNNFNFFYFPTLNIVPGDNSVRCDECGVKFCRLRTLYLPQSQYVVQVERVDEGKMERYREGGWRKDEEVERVHEGKNGEVALYRGKKLDSEELDPIA